MEYICVREAAEKWNMTERRVTALCRDGRIYGAKKTGKLWIIPQNAARPIDARTKEYAKAIESSLPGNIKAAEQGLASFDFLAEADVEQDGRHSAADAASLTLRTYEKIYKKKPDDNIFTPYRLCLLGAHCDHQKGKIAGFAIDKGIHMAYGAKQNGVVELASPQFPRRAQWHVHETPQEKQNDWADSLRGAVRALNKRYHLRVGLSAIFYGELPIGGLSSSAAMMLAFLAALCRVNDISATEKELIRISLEAEEGFAGVNCGMLDRACEVYSRKDALLCVDMRDESYELLPRNKRMKPFKIALFFTGMTPTLKSSEFNRRIEECKAAAFALMAFAGLPFVSFEEANLAAVARDIYLEYADRLPQDWRRRARHWYSEQALLEEGIKAWKRGDLEEFGRLVTLGGRSSIENWQTASPELIKLYELLCAEGGVYGARLVGSGFKGCCMALVEPEREAEIAEDVIASFRGAYPEASAAKAYVCETEDGIKLAVSR